MGFPVPLKEWLENETVREFVCDTVLSKRSRERGVFNIRSIEKMIMQNSLAVRELWGVLCLELWFSRFIDSTEM